jgi:hypothetical protein
MLFAKSPILPPRGVDSMRVALPVGKDIQDPCVWHRAVRAQPKTQKRYVEDGRLRQGFIWLDGESRRASCSRWTSPRWRPRSRVGTASSPGSTGRPEALAC